MSLVSFQNLSNPWDTPARIDTWLYCCDRIALHAIDVVKNTSVFALDDENLGSFLFTLGKEYEQSLKAALFSLVNFCFIPLKIGVIVKTGIQDRDSLSSTALRIFRVFCETLGLTLLCLFGSLLPLIHDINSHEDLYDVSSSSHYGGVSPPDTIEEPTQIFTQFFLYGTFLNAVEEELQQIEEKKLYSRSEIGEMEQSLQAVFCRSIANMVEKTFVAENKPSESLLRSKETRASILFQSPSVIDKALCTSPAVTDKRSRALFAASLLYTIAKNMQELNDREKQLLPYYLCCDDAQMERKMKDLHLQPLTEADTTSQKKIGDLKKTIITFKMHFVDHDFTRVKGSKINELFEKYS